MTPKVPQPIHIGAQVFFRLFWWDFRWFTFSFTFFGDFSSEIFGDSPFSSPFLVTFPVMNFAIHYIHHRFWWLSCHLFCHFDISLSFYLFWPFFRWPFRQPYKFITIFGASLVTFFVLIFFLPFYSPFLGDFFGDRSFYPTHLSVSLLLCLRGSVKEFKTFFLQFCNLFPLEYTSFYQLFIWLCSLLLCFNCYLDIFLLLWCQKRLKTATNIFRKVISLTGNSKGRRLRNDISSGEQWTDPNGRKYITSLRTGGVKPFSKQTLSTNKSHKCVRIQVSRTSTAPNNLFHRRKKGSDQLNNVFLF